MIYFENTYSQGPFEHIYDVCPIEKFSGMGRIIGNILVGDSKFLVINDKSYFLVESVGRTFFFCG